MWKHQVLGLGAYREKSGMEVLSPEPGAKVWAAGPGDQGNPALCRQDGPVGVVIGALGDFISMQN